MVATIGGEKNMGVLVVTGSSRGLVRKSQDLAPNKGGLFALIQHDLLKRLRKLPRASLATVAKQ